MSFTVRDYLRKKRAENPQQYGSYRDTELYQKLKSENDATLPQWGMFNSSQESRKEERKYYERKHSPDFVNGLFDWTDWGIDEGSSNWVKSAYNNSITGLAYQLYNGESKFDLSAYNPGIVEDVLSGVLSFMMPMDFAAMWVGGNVIGKAAQAAVGSTAMAERAFVQTATKNLMKLNINGLTEATAKEYAKKVLIKDTIKDAGLGAVLSAGAPRTAAAIGSASTLATFEGTRGGFQAAVDGTDIWEGIGKGVMHGGIMGGLVGAAGASLNIRNAKLLAKTEGKFQKTAGQQAELIATGIPGQLVAEAGIFTSQDALKVLTDDDYTFNDYMRSFATNIGMMGLLKAKAKVVDKNVKPLWEQGKEQVKEYWDRYKNNEGKIEESAKEAFNKVKETISEQPEVTTVSDPKAIKNVEDFVNKAEKKAGVGVGDRQMWEAHFDKAEAIIKRGDVKDLSVEDIAFVYKQIMNVRDAMEQNRGYWKTNINEKGAKVKELDALIEKWNKEIIEPTNDLEVAKNEREAVSIDARNKVAMEWTEVKKHAAENGHLDALKEVKRQNETHIDKKNELDFDNFNVVTLKKQIDNYNDIYREKTQIDTSAPISQQRNTAIENLKSVVRNQKSTEDFRREAEAIQSATEKPKVVDIAKKSKIIEDAVLGTEGSKTREKYEESKLVLKFARDNLRKKPTGDSGRQLRDLGEIAKELAFDGRSLLEITNKDIEKYAKKLLGEGRVNDTKKSRLRSILEQLHEIHSNTDYMGIFSSRNKSYITATKPFQEASNILRRFESEVITKQGIIPSGKAKDANFEIKDGIIEIYTGKNKKGEADVKFVTKKTSDLLESLVKEALLDGRKPGDNKFIFKSTDGTAIHSSVANAISKQLFGKNLRAFRYSLTEYAIKEYGIKSEQYKIAHKLQQAHKQDIKDFYDAYGDKFATRTAVRKFLKRYYKDVKDGSYKQIKGKKGFTSKQLTKGLEKIEGMKDTDIMKFKYKDNPKAKTFKTTEINGKTLKAMFRYAIEGGSRTNEIVPELSTLRDVRKIAQENIKIESKRQLESEIKLGEKAAGIKKLKELADWANEVAPELTINLEKKDLGKFEGKYILGRITGHLVEIATGRAKADTIPHEVSHRVVDVLLATGTPQSRKLVEDGIRMFRKKGMTKAQAEEALVEAVGKYTLSRIEGKRKAPEFAKNKTIFGKVKNFVSRAVSYLRNFFGIRNEADINKIRNNIVSKIGEKVYTGSYKSDYMPTSIKTKYHTLNTSTSTGEAEIMKLHKEIKGEGAQKGLEYEAENHYGLTKKEKMRLREEAFGKGKLDKKGSYKLDNVLVENMESYQRVLNQYIADVINGASPQLASKRQKVIRLEGERNVSEIARDKYFRDFFDVKFENATDSMIEAYREQLVKLPKYQDKSDTIVANIINVLSNKANVGSFNALKRAAMRSGEVIEQWAAQSKDPSIKKLGKKIARTLREHDYIRNNYKQYGDRVVAEIKELLPKEITGEKIFDKKGYMDMIDPVHAKETIQGLYELKQKFIDKEYIGDAKFITKKIKELESMVEKFQTDPKFIKAKELWNDGAKGGLSNYYWENLKSEIKGHVSGRTYRDIEAQLNKQYINGYMMKRLTKKALEGLTQDNAQLIELAEKIRKSLSKEELIEIAERVRENSDNTISKKSQEYQDIIRGRGEFLKNHISNEIFDMITYGPNSATVKPAFLKERSATLPYYIQINGKRGKQWVQTYESSLDGTIGHYSAGMGKFLSTVRYFPEFTEIGRSFRIKSGMKRNQMESYMGGKDFGEYVLLATKQQLGLDFNSRDVLNKGYHKYAANATNFSAWAGLSSPLSGAKNFLIQIPRNMALYGTRNTLKSMVKGLEIMRDPKLRLKAIERGEIGYGLKQVLSEVEALHGPIKATFEKFNLMGQSENFNRIVAAEASRMHFNSIIPKLRGESSMFFPTSGRAEIMRVLKETFKLTDVEINFLEKGKDILGTKRYKEITDWVAHQGHKAAAGATGTIDLPLWMQSKHAKPFTLFTRIATSVTIDSYKNYIVPMKNGNVAPIIKAAVGHGLAGAALYSIYDVWLGKQPTREDSPAMDRLMAYLWRGEALGMFGELISPHDKQGSLPIMEPVVLRNITNIGTELGNVLNVGKPFSEAVNEIIKKSVVAYGQGEQLITSRKHPYATDYKRIRALEKEWRKRMGIGYQTPNVNMGLITPRQYHYWKLKESIIYGKSDSDIARNYYVALNTVMHELELSGMSSKHERMKKAKSYLRKVIKNMSPLNLPTKTRGRNQLTSKRNEFLNSLSKENRRMALRLEKEYEYKVRAFSKIIEDSKWRRLYSIYPS